MSHASLSQIARAVTIGAMVFAAATVALGQAPDNTKVNTRDREPGAITADQQKNNLPDRQASQKIRRSLMRDKGLSTYAHNVKIVAVDGQVTLKGPVRSDAEKEAVEAKAVEVMGPGHVVNELTVAPNKSTRK
jgi:hyperosmotically inducible protein